MSPTPTPTVGRGTDTPVPSPVPDKCCHYATPAPEPPRVPPPLGFCTVTATPKSEAIRAFTPPRRRQRPAQRRPSFARAGPSSRLLHRGMPLRLRPRPWLPPRPTQHQWPLPRPVVLRLGTWPADSSRLPLADAAGSPAAHGESAPGEVPCGRLSSASLVPVSGAAAVAQREAVIPSRRRSLQTRRARAPRWPRSRTSPQSTTPCRRAKRVPALRISSNVTTCVAKAAGTFRDEHVFARVGIDPLDAHHGRHDRLSRAHGLENLHLHSAAKMEWAPRPPPLAAGAAQDIHKSAHFDAR